MTSPPPDPRFNKFFAQQAEATGRAAWLAAKGGPYPPMDNLDSPMVIAIRGQKLSPAELLESIETLRTNGWITDDEVRGLLGAPRRYSRHPSGALTLTDEGLRRWRG